LAVAKLIYDGGRTCGEPIFERLAAAAASFNGFKMNISLIFRLVAHDLRSRALGSKLGFIWAFIQPIVMTIILLFVVRFAFKAHPMRGVSCLAWLLVGMSAWSFISEALHQATVVFCEYAFLVRKINFRLSILPVVKIFSALAIHMVFLVVVAIVLILSGVKISWHWLGALYYLFSAFMLMAGVAALTSTLHVFLRDVGHMVSVALQFAFWITPIFWDFSMLPLPANSVLYILLRLNPLVYIVEGYRNSFIFGVPFAAGWLAFLYFWGVTLVFLLLGALVFRKLRPQFADVL
jgi:lipopolysaccharide transport system permease protein/teichoic acid transport system permease protein